MKPASFQAKTGDLVRHWYVIDASNQVVGRLAAQIAPLLMGKHKPTYTPSVDTGDFVIVTNVEKVVFTGQKWQQKSYQRYSGYPGGQKEEAAWHLFERHPERILELAIKRMMPKNKIGRHMLTKLKLIIGPEHTHQSQCPIVLEPVSGRVAAAGLEVAPKMVVNPPTRKKKRVKKQKEVESAPAAEAPVAEPAQEPVSGGGEDQE